MKKRHDHTANMVVKPPQTNVTHNHGTSWAAIIFSSAAVALIGLFLLYHFALAVLENAGYRNPRETLALGLIVGPVVLLFVVAGGFAIGKLIGSYFDYRLQMKELDLEDSKYKAMVLQRGPVAVHASRLTEEEQKYVALLTAVMSEAYTYLQKFGPYKNKQPRPWSRRPAMQFTLAKWGDKPTETMAGNVRSDLTRWGVILKDQINTSRYKTFEDFSAKLEQEFGIPVQVNAQPVAPPSPSHIEDHYQHI